MGKGFGDGSAYITSPPLRPVLPATITTAQGRTMPTREALPIARALLLEGIKALKQIPGGGKSTAYALERANFHLQRVTFLRADEPSHHAALSPGGGNPSGDSTGAT